MPVTALPVAGGDRDTRTRTRRARSNLALSLSLAVARIAVSDPSQTPTGIDYGGGGSEPRKPLQNWMATSELTDKDAHLYRSIDEKTKFPGGSWMLRPDWLQKLSLHARFEGEQAAQDVHA